LQYLESDAANPKIEKLSGFDWISSGGASRYSEELLRSPRFQSLLKELSARYDWILATTPATLPSAEAENLSCLFDASVVVVTHESLNTLIAFSEALPAEKEERLSFVFS
jgi:cellulose biosynthesis protein BcsQ